MIEKPNLADDSVAASVYRTYGLVPAEVEFLPLGADVNTAVYRVMTDDGTVYFLKLRRGSFEPTSVTLPAWLHAQGIGQIIAPLQARSGSYWAEIDDFTSILYPFVAGRDAYEIALTDDQWQEFGAAMRRIHTAVPPASIAGRIPRETWSPQWRQRVMAYVEGAGAYGAVDAVAAEVVALLQTRRVMIFDLIARAERLARGLQRRSDEFVVCHSDLHAGNLHIADDGALYLVDWDNPIWAPKERDLMYPGAGLFGSWRLPAAEEALFYAGYGPADVDPAALAYYRYERIVQDIAAYCEQLLGSDEGGEDRPQSLHYLASNFLPGGLIDIASAADAADG